MLYLKQSTASQAVILGPFIDEDDGKTAEAGLTIANTDIRLSANGGNMFSKTSGGGTHDEAGWYTVTFDATDTATVGRLQVSVDVAGALPVWMEFQVLEEDIYDALIGASAAAFDTNQRVDVGEWLGAAAATPNTAGVPLMDLVRIVGGIVPTPTTTGVPDVNVERWLDTLVTLGAGAPDVNIQSADTDSINAAAVAADVKALLFGALGVEGTADAGGNTTTIRDAALTQAEGFFIGSYVLFTNNTNAGRVVRCVSFTAATDDLGFLPAVGAAVGAGDTYIILNAGYGQADMVAISGDETAADNAELDYDGTGYDKANSTIGTTTVNTDMRGTENAFLASVGGALADVAAAGDPTAVDTAMQYLKQLINVLVGTAGVVTYPAAAAPGNGVNLAQVVRENFNDVTGLNGDAMRGTNSAALDSVATEGRLSELDGANLPADVDAILADTGTTIPALLPAALIGGRMDSDVEAINNNTTAAAQLALSAEQIESGTCEGTPSTTVIQTDLAETQDDIYIGRVVIFTSGNARGEATDITDYTGATGTLQVTALANAPAAADTFILI